MGWREHVACRPLFGNQEIIDKFNKDFPDGIAYFDGYKHDPTSEITEAYPDVVFYGLYTFNNTCGEFTYHNIVFCNNDCCDVRGKGFDNYGGQADVPIDEDLTIVARDDRDYRPPLLDSNKSLVDAIQDILNLAKEFNIFDYADLEYAKWKQDHPESARIAEENLKKAKELNFDNNELPY